MVVVISPAGPGPVETGESSVGWKIFGTTEALIPPSQHVTGVAHAGQIFRQ